MKNLYLKTIAILFILSICNFSRSQDQTFNLGVINFQYGDTLGGTHNRLIFDIVLQHTNSEVSAPFEYAIAQYFLTFNPEISNGGALSYRKIGSDLPPDFQPVNPSISGNLLRMAANFPYNPGPVISITSPGTLIARMKFYTTASSFAEVPLDLNWRTPDMAGFVTKVAIFADNIIYDISFNGNYYIDSLNNYEQINLLYPPQNSTGLPSSINFIWSNVNIPARYTLHVSADSNMNSRVFFDSLITDTSRFVSGLILGEKYYWRITVHDTAGISYYSDINNFRTKQFAVYPADNAADLSPSVNFIWNRPGENVSYYLLSISQDSILIDNVPADTVTADTSLTIDGFLYNSKYFWRVKAFYSDSTSDISTLMSFRTKNVSVNLVSPLNNSVNLSNIVTFKWTMPSINTSKYYLKISQDSLQNNVVYYDSVSGTSTTAGYFNLNTKYYWSVSIRDTNNNIIRSAVWNFKTGILNVNLYSPPNNTIDEPVSTKLRWLRPVINVSKYKLTLSTDSLQNNIVLLDSSITDTVHTLNNLNFETTYYWSIEAKDTIGNEKRSDVWKFRTSTFLYSPQNNSIFYGNSMFFNWYKLQGAVSYKLEIASDVGFTNTFYSDSTITDSVKFVNSLPDYIYYYWRVSAKNLNGYFRTSEVWNLRREYTVPVEITGFESVVDQNNITLNWSSVYELNNSGFEIERSDLLRQTSNVRGQTSQNQSSSTGGDWIKVGFVNGNGTSSSGHTYIFTDRNLATGTYSYRLKQIDFNGNFEYFNLNKDVNIGVPGKFKLSQNYPNPFNPGTNLEFEIPELGFVSLKVYDISGREVITLVNEQKAPGYYTVSFNGAGLSSGIYFYTLNAGRFVSTKKMTLIK